MLPNTFLSASRSGTKGGTVGSVEQGLTHFGKVGAEPMDKGCTGDEADSFLT